MVPAPRKPIPETTCAARLSFDSLRWTLCRMQVRARLRQHRRGGDGVGPLAAASGARCREEGGIAGPATAGAASERRQTKRRAGGAESVDRVGADRAAAIDEHQSDGEARQALADQMAHSEPRARASRARGAMDEVHPQRRHPQRRARGGAGAPGWWEPTSRPYARSWATTPRRSSSARAPGASAREARRGRRQRAARAAARRRSA